MALVRGERARRVMRRARLGVAILAVALTGAVLGVLLGAHTQQDVGPFDAQLTMTPGLRGDTEVRIPPLGAVHLDSHDGPAHLTVQLNALDRGRTEALVTDPDGLIRASNTAVEDVETGMTRLVLQTTGAAVLGALVLALLIFRDTRRTAWAGGTALVVTAGSLGFAVATFRPTSIEEPRYEGMLAYAPAVVGDAQRIADRYDEYRSQLQRMVRNASRLYGTVSKLPIFEPEPGTTRVLHVSDLHLNPSAWSVISTVVESFQIDVVVDTGDITDWGSEPEASYYLSAIGTLDVPYVFVRGNHDSSLTAAGVARMPNAIVLENDVRLVRGLTIAGVGDPRFTPDKETSPPGSATSKQTLERVIDTGTNLADAIRRAGGADIALVHDPASAGGLAGAVPVVLAGHTHQREVRQLEVSGPSPASPQTMLMIQGSTGGAGLRGLEPEVPLPLALSVLYFDQDEALKAYDDIRVGGTGLATISLSRTVVPLPARAESTQD